MEPQIAVGRVRRPHGLNGAFKVLSFSGEYEHLAKPKVYRLKNGDRFRDFEVEWVKISGPMTLVKLKGLDNLKQPVSSLSGGNQQKVVFSKWLVSNCNILIFSEPTRGVDVGAKEEIYELIRQYIYDGGSVIMVTSEISEAIMCDRILVMSHGTIKGEIKHEDISSEESVLSLF